MLVQFVLLLSAWALTREREISNALCRSFIVSMSMIDFWRVLWHLCRQAMWSKKASYIAFSKGQKESTCLCTTRPWSQAQCKPKRSKWPRVLDWIDFFLFGTIWEGKNHIQCLTFSSMHAQLQIKVANACRYPMQCILLPIYNSPNSK